MPLLIRVVILAGFLLLTGMMVWVGQGCSGLTPSEAPAQQESGQEPTVADAGGNPDQNLHTNIGKITPEECGSCHVQHYEEWRGSMHAYALKDPVFLAMIAKGQIATQGKLDQFCVQCHAPSASKLGLTPVLLGAGGQHEMVLDMKQPLVAHGVQCVTCHTIKSVEATLNAKFTLSQTTYFGATGSAEANKAHPMAKSSLLVDSRMCGSCHNVVNPKGALLENTFSEWYASDFNGTTTETTKRCQDCHMSTYQGPIVKGGAIKTLHRHTFVGVDQALIRDFPNKAEQAELVKKLLQSCATVEIVRKEDVSNQVALVVNVTSINNGHNLPSGSTADRQVWIHLEVKDQTGKLLYESGMLDANGDLMDRIEGHSLTPLGDPHLFMFGQFLFNEKDEHVNFPWEASRTKDALLAPGQTAWREYLIPRSQLNVEQIEVIATLKYRTFPPFLIRKLESEGFLKKGVLEPIPIVDMARSQKSFRLK